MVIVLRRGLWRWLAAAALAAAAFSVSRSMMGPAVRVLSGLVVARELPIYRVAVPDRRIAISFDAMWGTDYTDRLLEILHRHRVKATFFLGGHWVETYPNYVRKIVEMGHELGNHTYTHPHLNTLSPEQIRDELLRNHIRIESISGFSPFLFRPPFGEYSDKVIRVARELGYYTIQWSVDSLDWKDVSADYIFNRILSLIQPGDIVLFHNNGRYTADAVDRLIPELKRRGYQIVPVSELIYRNDFVIEQHNGEQRPRTGPTLQPPGQHRSSPPGADPAVPAAAAPAGSAGAPGYAASTGAPASAELPGLSQVPGRNTPASERAFPGPP